MKPLFRTLVIPLLVPSILGANTPAGTVEIDPEVQASEITDWGFDIKNASQISSVSASFATERFVNEGMSVMRIAVWGEATRPAHPGPGQIDTTYYEHDGDPGALHMIRAMKNTRNARPDILFFASKKLDGQSSFPAWVMDGTNGVDPVQYARMLADYLRFMEHDLTRKDESFVIPILGIDNEKQYNEGNITASRHLAIVNALRDLSVEPGMVDLTDVTHATDPVVSVPAAFTMPMIIGPEDYHPKPAMVSSLLALPGGPESLDIVGTHYYPSARSQYNNLGNLIGNGLGRPAWHSEVHWDSPAGDELNGAINSLATIFDCTDLGITGFSWWAYSAAGFSGGIRKAITTTTIGARGVQIDDEDGNVSPEPEASLITRAFRQGNTLNIWVLNKGASSYTDHAFNLLRGNISGDVTYQRWSDSGSSMDTSGGNALATGTSFTSTLPGKSITLFSLPFISSGPVAVLPLDGDPLDTTGNNNHGLPSGTVNYGTGRRNGGLDLRGVTGSLTMPRVVSDDFTIAFWLRAFTPGATDAGSANPQWWQGSGLVDGEVNGTANDFGVSLRDTRICFGVGAPDTSVFSQSSVSDGQWRHISITRNSSTGEMAIFINGRQDSALTGPKGSKAAPAALRIGNRLTGGKAFNGELDDVRIYDRVLETAEFQDLANFAPHTLVSETWDNISPVFLTGIGTVQSDNPWTYNGRNRSDWGIIATGSPFNSNTLRLQAEGTNNSSTDAETPLPAPLDLSAVEWITLKAKFALNDTTTSTADESRLYAVDAGRQNGYGILARAKSDTLAPVTLRVFSGGVSTNVMIGGVGSQELDLIYDVTASFQRVSDIFTKVRYRILKGGNPWQSGESLVTAAPLAGVRLTKLEVSQGKSAFSAIDDLSISIQPDLRDLAITSLTREAASSAFVSEITLPALGVPYHLEVADDFLNFTPIGGSTFHPDVTPWRLVLPLDPNTVPRKFVRVHTGQAP